MDTRSLLEHNIDLLVPEDPELAERLKNIEPTEVEVVQAKSGVPTLKRGNIYLHSAYDPVKEAQRRADEIEEHVRYVVLFGFGMGYLAEALIEKLGNIEIVAYDPDEEALAAAFRTRRMPFDKGSIKIYGDMDVFHSRVFATYRTNENITVVMDPAWRRRYPQKIAELHSELQRYVTYRHISESTAMARMRPWIHHVLGNLPAHARRPSLKGLSGRFKDVPIVLCAAGPSLDKNVELLKGIEDRVIVIAVNTAYRALATRGIKVHMVTALESFDISSQFEGLPISEVPLVAPLSANPRLFEMGFRRIHSYVDHINYYALWIKKAVMEDVVLDVGGSVACSSLSLALFLGGNPIILIGQDLAYSQGRMYASGTVFEDIEVDVRGDVATLHNLDAKKRIYEASGVDPDSVKDRAGLVRVKGWYGDEVHTSEDFNFFRVWFESVARTFKDIRLVNATEGGAYINGYEHIPLKQILDETLTDTPHGFDQALEELEPIENYIPRLREHTEKTIKGIREVKKLAKRLQDKAEKGKKMNPDSPSFSRLLESIERMERKVKKESKSLPLLHGYSLPPLYQMRLSMADVLKLEPEKAWKVNMEATAYVGQSIADSARELAEKLREFLDTLEE